LAIDHITTDGWLRSRSNEFANLLNECRLRFGTDWSVAEGRRRRQTHEASGHAEIESDRSGFIDDNDSATVGVVEHFFGVGVVRGSERIRADPFQQREIVDHVCVVVTFPAHEMVLMHAETFEIKRFAVDEEL